MYNRQFLYVFTSLTMLEQLRKEIVVEERKNTLTAFCVLVFSREIESIDCVYVCVCVCIHTYIGMCLVTRSSDSLRPFGL